MALIYIFSRVRKHSLCVADLLALFAKLSRVKYLGSVIIYDCVSFQFSSFNLFFIPFWLPSEYFRCFVNFHL